MFEPQFPRPDRTLFTEELKNRLILQGPSGWNGALAALPSPLVGQDLYKGGKALADTSDLDQHAQSVCKVREQPTGEEKRQNERTDLSAIFKDICGKTVSTSSSSGNKLIESQCVLLVLLLFVLF